MFAHFIEQLFYWLVHACPCRARYRHSKLLMLNAVQACLGDCCDLMHGYVVCALIINHNPVQQDCNRVFIFVYKSYPLHFTVHSPPPPPHTHTQMRMCWSPLTSRLHRLRTWRWYTAAALDLTPPHLPN